VKWPESPEQKRLREAWEKAHAEHQKLIDELNDALERGEIVDEIADRAALAGQAEDEALAAMARAT